MPETLNGDETQVNLANTASVNVAAAGEYRRRTNSLVTPFQRVTHWLEALREKVNLIAPIDARVVILEGTTLGTAFVRALESPYGNGGANVNRLYRTRGTDAAGPNTGDWNADKTVGPTGSGADIVWTALDAIAGAGVVTLALSARTMAYNLGDPSLYVGDGTLTNLSGVIPIITLPTSGVAVRTQTPFFVVTTDANRLFKVRATTTSFSANNFQEYELFLQGHYR